MDGIYHNRKVKNPETAGPRAGESLAWTLVNLGAEDGGCHHGRDKYWMHDPANCLLEEEPRWSGILIEGDPATLPSLRKRYAERDNVLCVGGLLTPEKARAAILAAQPCGGDGVPRSAKAEQVVANVAAGKVDLLKVDVDWGDCDFIEKLAEWMTPKFVHAEVNPYFPPPYSLRQHFDERLLRSGLLHTQPARWEFVRGCSLSGIAQALGGPQKYVLAQLEFDHALFVRKDIAPRALPLWPRAGQLRLWDHWLANYHCHPLRRVIRTDERALRFDFRSIVATDVALQQEAEEAMRRLLKICGALEMPRDHMSKHQWNLLEPRVPVSLERCEECG
eukprot:gnl/TRDRNA2_/TRDRNA2_124470_c0_seq2.p1 gnl/TRDRNA2_/TRDRNA2_124470_c0~~gnl/TRDRNA2_/TRDRNA2_124470_c0_seq2.p1  ORF type:complete len:334 (-),score=54.62 gnl/TRDRNA2_/TRDRNA2_124470_c0_seq2:63-1064(-)